MRCIDIDFLKISTPLHCTIEIPLMELLKYPVVTKPIQLLSKLVQLITKAMVMGKVSILIDTFHHL